MHGSSTIRMQRLSVFFIFFSKSFYDKKILLILLYIRTGPFTSSQALLLPETVKIVLL